MTTETSPQAGADFPGQPIYDTYSYQCPDCRRVLVRHAPYDATPAHPDPDAPGRPCPGGGGRVIFLGHARASAPGPTAR